MSLMHKRMMIAVLGILLVLTGCAKSQDPQEELPQGPGVALAAENTESSKTQADAGEEGRVLLADGFYYIRLNDDLKRRITGKSYPSDDSDLGIHYSDLRYIHLLYYDFKGNEQQGELIVHEALADEVTQIFHELYKQKYAFSSIRLVDDFDADDEASMEANNTSCFNFRMVEGTKTRSLHSYGMAIDINPLFNPYVKGKDVDPDSAKDYADRSKDFPGKIDKDDVCYKLFAENGWEWGGDWRTVKDYQHFSKEVER